jgi:hypothetical protein
MSMDDSQHDAYGGSAPFGDENPFGDNPYASPSLQASKGPVGQYAPLPRSPGRGMVGHVQVVAILMIVQGALEALMGFGLVAMGGFFPAMMQMEMDRGNAGQQPPIPAEAMSWMMLVIYGGLGLLVLIAAGLHIFAGIRNYQFRGRILGLVALGGGMVTVLTCYCAPTAIGLGVYGLITYLNPEVAQAFAMGEAKRSKDDILAAFG